MQVKEIFFTLLLFVFLISAQAKCIIPVPDGMEIAASSRNVAGHLIEVTERKMLVKKYGENKVVVIRLTGLEDAYSAFGGDEKVHKLNAGVAVRVWYERCKNTARPNAAYIEYFSNNIGDQPDASYFERKGH